MGINKAELNWCSGLAAVSLLNLSLGSAELSSLSPISPRSFSLHFPSQFLFVVVENCASMQSKAFSVKWPVFECSRGVLLNCSNKLLLIWRCGVVSLLRQRFIHFQQALAPQGRSGCIYDFVFVIRFGSLLPVGLNSNMSKIHPCQMEFFRGMTKFFQTST